MFGVAGIDAGNEGADESVEEFRGKFSLDECGDRFVDVGRSATAQDVTENAPFRSRAEKGRAEECGRA